MLPPAQRRGEHSQPSEARVQTDNRAAQHMPRYHQFMAQPILLKLSCTGKHWSIGPQHEGMPAPPVLQQASVDELEPSMAGQRRLTCCATCYHAILRHLQVANELAALRHGARAAARHQQSARPHQRHREPVQLPVPVWNFKASAHRTQPHNLLIVTQLDAACSGGSSTTHIPASLASKAQIH